jgi:MscS family membrane protein
MPDILIIEGDDTSLFTVQRGLRLVIAIAIILASILLRKIVTEALTKILSVALFFLPDSKKHITDILSGPIEFTCFFAGVYAAGTILQLPDELQVFFRSLLYSFLDVLIFWILYRAVSPLSLIVQKTGTGQVSDEIRKVIVDLVELGMIIFGFLTMLQAWGVNVTAFLAGLGLVGMAVALAAQDTLRNLFASVAMFADGSFKKGEWIKTSAVEGIVEKVSLRTTTIRKFDTSTVVIPNANLANGTITNFSVCPHRRVVWSLPISGGATIEQYLNTQKKVDHYVRQHQAVRHEGDFSTVIVALDEFGENCINLFVYFYTHTPEWLPYMRIKQEMILEIKTIIEEESKGFGVPTRDIRMVKV